MVIHTQQQHGIDLPTEGEPYRFDVNHPDTNGMIEYFISRLGGIDTNVGLSDARAFQQKQEMSFRRKPAGVVPGPIGEGSLDLFEACARSASVANGPLKFTLTSPYMLARTLLDNHYGSLKKLTLAIGDALAEQVSNLPCACVQVDDANVPGSPEDAPIAQAAINKILDQVRGQRAVHFCFGNYGGQTIQAGGQKPFIDFLNILHTDTSSWSSPTGRRAFWSPPRRSTRRSRSESASSTSKSTTSKRRTKSPNVLLIIGGIGSQSSNRSLTTDFTENTDQAE